MLAPRPSLTSFSRFSMRLNASSMFLGIHICTVLASVEGRVVVTFLRRTNTRVRLRGSSPVLLLALSGELSRQKPGG